MKWLVVAGYRHVGPFNTERNALDWANINIKNSCWYVTRIEAP